MTVYVDDMYRYPLGQFRGMRMSHMIADTEAELHGMAAAIGMQRHWYQGDHYDLNEERRAAAIRAGALPITLRQCAVMAGHRRRHGGPLPSLEEADLMLAAMRNRAFGNAP